MRLQHGGVGRGMEARMHVVLRGAAEEPNPETARALLRLMLVSGTDD